MDLVFSSSEAIKPKILLHSIDDAGDVSLQNKIKEETSETELDIYAKEGDTCKTRIKSERLDLECDSTCDDGSIKLELLHEELDLKTETLSNDLVTHTRENSFRCGVCTYTSTNKSDFKRHLMTHTGEKPFKCCVCGYASGRKDSLALHIKGHNGEKPFKCSVCGYASADKSSMRKHMITHTGEKPFKCSVCNYAAARKHQLTRHMNTHTGEKSFECYTCGYKFSLKSYLQQHILKMMHM